MDFGGIVNASRSLSAAYKLDIWKQETEEKDFAQATRKEAIRMRDELKAAMK
jgi:orotidine-5'-phosphate decarboxylase